MKIARSVRLLRFGGVLALSCIVDGVDVVLHDGFAAGAEPGATGFGIKIVVDCGQRAQKQAADVGEDAGAARRDTSLGCERVERAEGVVNALSVLKAAGLLGQDGQEVCVVMVERGSVVRAQSGGRIAGKGAALAPGGGAMLATRRRENGVG